MQSAGKLNGAIENIRLRGFLCQSQCGLGGTIANRQGHIGQLPSATNVPASIFKLLVQPRRRHL
jgi:hypothetical protein